MNKLISKIAWLLFSIAALSSWQQPSYAQNTVEYLEKKYVTADDSFINVDGARVRVRIEGPDGGEPLLLIHGFTASLESWDGWAKNLSDDYRVIRYDLLGHGLTGPDKHKRYSPAARAKFLGNLIDALGIKNINIAGNSLGGLVAWRYTVQHLENVKKLILVDAGAFSINGVTDTPLPVPAHLETYLRSADTKAVHFTLSYLMADKTNLTDKMVTTFSEMMQRSGNGQAFVDHITAFILPDPRDELRTITAPTLILWGGKDTVIPPIQATWLNQAIKNSSLKIFDDLGHMPHEEKPVDTANLVRAFLKK